jgi:type IV secretion system protein VirB4
MSGFDLPRQAKYANPATEVFATDRITFLEKTAGFRRIDLHWCLTLEPSKVKAFERKPQENAVETSRMLADLEKTATILQSHLGNAIGLRLLGEAETFQFFSYLFNLEEWAERDQLRSDTGVDRQIVKTPVAWHSDHLQVGKRYVQMFSLKTTPEASRPCLFSGLLTLDCDSVLCSTWRVKSTSSARSEIDAQEKFISFFKVGVLTRVMSGRDTASLETGAAAKAANNNVDDLSEVIRSLDKKAQGEYSLRLLLAARSQEQLRNTVPMPVAPRCWRRCPSEAEEDKEERSAMAQQHRALGLYVDGRAAYRALQEWSTRTVGAGEDITEEGRRRPVGMAAGARSI